MLLAVDQLISVPVLESRNLEYSLQRQPPIPGERIARLANEGWRSMNIEAMEAGMSD